MKGRHEENKEHIIFFGFDEDEHYFLECLEFGKGREA